MQHQETTTQNDAKTTVSQNQQPGQILAALQGDSSIKLQWESTDYNVRAIDSTAFVAECVPLVYQHDPRRVGVVITGSLSTRTLEVIPIRFRVTGFRDNLVRCDFYELDEPAQENINALVNRIHHATPSNHPSSRNTPGQRSTQKPAVQTQRVKNTATPSTSPPRKRSKLLRYALMACAAIFAIGFLFGEQGELVPVADSYLGERSFVVRTPEPGQLVKVLVNVGDSVEAGDVMAKLVKGSDKVKIETIDAKVETAEKELVVFERQKVEAKAAISRNKQIVQTNLQQALQDKVRLAKKVESAQVYLQRIAPLIESENIGTQEVAELKDAVERAKADLDSQEIKIKNLNFAMKAADRDAVFTEHGIMTPTKDIADKIELAEARLKELTRKRSAIEEIVQTVDIVAPESGTVQAVYLAKGKEHSAADQAIELKLGNRLLLTGFVIPERASSIKPGQNVEVVVPKRNLTLNGKVTSVGQVGKLKLRTKERRLPTDIAVQVQLEKTEHELAPNEKMNVSVSTKPNNASAISQWFRSMFSGSDEST